MLRQQVSFPLHVTTHAQFCYQFEGSRCPPKTYVHTKFRENPSSGSKSVTGWHTDKTQPTYTVTQTLAQSETHTLALSDTCNGTVWDTHWHSQTNTLAQSEIHIGTVRQTHTAIAQYTQIHQTWRYQKATFYCFKHASMLNSRTITSASVPLGSSLLMSFFFVWIYINS
jgi:hypothetical protein